MNEEKIRAYFNQRASSYDRSKMLFGYFHACLTDFCSSMVPAGKDVLEVGCATGDLLSALKPANGVGIDISENMIEIAKSKYCGLGFYTADIDHFAGNNTFDYIILSHLLDYMPDIMDFFITLKKFLKKDTKIVITTVNALWEPVIAILEKLRIRKPDQFRNYVTNCDVTNILTLLDYDIIEFGYRFIFSVYIPLVSNIVNRLFARIPGLRNLCFLQYIVAKPRVQHSGYSCSVVIPCYNEIDNIEACIRGVPGMGTYTEIVVVDDGSVDGTADKARSLMKEFKNLKLVSYNPNKGKAYALKNGFSECTGDVIIILDADMGVSPLELPRFFTPILEGRAEFVNGTRMVYPMESEAMNFLKFLGNKFFGITLSIIMGQRNTDVLCGTKSFLRKYLPYMKMDKCKWGDFDLLFSAARLKMKIIEMPVHYKSRTAGRSKMKAFHDGAYFLRACWRGFLDLY